MVRKTRVVTVEGAKGGKGSVEMHHFLEENELLGHGLLYARVIIKPHSSVGWHQHVGTTEPYAIIKGEGVFIDTDGSKTTVHSGDVCHINVGDFHSIENNTEEDLEMIALVFNDRAI